MGRSPCCAKEGANRGAWSDVEDQILTDYVTLHGEGNWWKVAQNAGLNRCFKSCRLGWVTYLKPGIKRGAVSAEEEELIIRLHRLLGNRWALIAARLPGRTDNKIKNYWNTSLVKKHQAARPDEQDEDLVNMINTGAKDSDTKNLIPLHAGDRDDSDMNFLNAGDEDFGFRTFGIEFSIES